jgi:hypothetical protein
MATDIQTTVEALQNLAVDTTADQLISLAGQTIEHLTEAGFEADIDQDNSQATNFQNLVRDFETNPNEWKQTILFMWLVWWLPILEELAAGENV